MSAILIASGCATTTRFVVARSEPAPLAGVRRPAVAFQGAAGHAAVGQALADAVAVRLRAAGLEPSVGEGDLEGADATILGWIDGFEASAGRASIRAQVTRRGGQTALPAIEVVGGPIGAGPLVEEAAARVATALLPGPVALIEVDWESAGDWDEAAREHMAQDRVADALAALEDALPRAKAAAVDAETLSALHYDLGLCLHLVGRDAEAERAFDEALTLFNSELHLTALHDLRRRRAERGEGGRR